MVILKPLLDWLRKGQDAPHRLSLAFGVLHPGGRLVVYWPFDIPLDELKAVVDALPAGGPVRHLMWNRCKLGDAGAELVVAGALRSGAATLYLGDNEIGPRGARRIAARLMAYSESLRGLWLVGNPIGPAGIRAFTRLVAEGRSPELLDLGRTGMVPSELTYLAKALATGQVVRRLYLCGNDFGDAPALAALGSVGLAELHLTACGLGDAGARTLAAGLRPGLKRLSVASNDMGPEASTELVRAAVRIGLEALELGRTRYPRESQPDNRVDPAAIAEVLAAGPHGLTHLNLRNTGVDSRGALALLAGAERAPTPTRFELGDGIAKRVKRDLAVLAVELPELAPHPDVVPLGSVNRMW